MDRGSRDAVAPISRNPVWTDVAGAIGRGQLDSVLDDPTAADTFGPILYQCLIDNAPITPADIERCAARKLCRCWSGGISALVYESVASAGSQHSERHRGSLGRLIDWYRWSLAGRLAWSMLVVVGDVVDDEAFEPLTVPDDRAVEEFSSDGSDPAFACGRLVWSRLRSGLR